MIHIESSKAVESNDFLDDVLLIKLGSNCLPYLLTLSNYRVLLLKCKINHQVPIIIIIITLIVIDVKIREKRKFDILVLINLLLF